MLSLLAQLTPGGDSPAGDARRAAEAIRARPEAEIAVFPELLSRRLPAEEPGRRRLRARGRGAGDDRRRLRRGADRGDRRLHRARSARLPRLGGLHRRRRQPGGRLPQGPAVRRGARRLPGGRLARGGRARRPPGGTVDLLRPRVPGARPGGGDGGGRSARHLRREHGALRSRTPPARHGPRLGEPRPPPLREPGRTRRRLPLRRRELRDRCRRSRPPRGGRRRGGPARRGRPSRRRRRASRLLSASNRPGCRWKSGPGTTPKEEQDECGRQRWGTSLAGPVHPESDRPGARGAHRRRALLQRHVVERRADVRLLLAPLFLLLQRLERDLRLPDRRLPRPAWRVPLRDAGPDHAADRRRLRLQQPQPCIRRSALPRTSATASGSLSSTASTRPTSPAMGSAHSAT